MDDMMMNGAMMGWMNVMGVLWSLLAAALIALAVAGTLWLVRSRSARAGAAPVAGRATLDRRYAAGELSRDEYLERRRDLED